MKRSARRGRTEHQSGFTIIELMMAMFVFATIFTAVAAALTTTMRSTRGSTNRVIAANVAAEDLDKLRFQASKDYANVTDLLGPTTATRTVKGVPYTIEREASWVGGGTATSPCDGGSTTTPAYIRVTSKITWPGMNGIKPVSSQTLIAPPVGVYDPTSGNAAVKVLGASGTPKGAILVELTGPSGPQSLYTTSDGCAYFVNLPPGSYSIKISRPGHADRQGQVAPIKTAGVNLATTTPFAFEYDLLGSMDATLRPVWDSSGPTIFGHLPQSAALTLENTGLQPTGTALFPGTGATRSIPSLYPFTGGYNVWAGSCADADPDFHGTSLRSDPLDVQPGGTVTGFVDLPSIRLDVDNHTGLDAGFQVRLVHAPGAGCLSGETLTYDSLALTDVSGRIVVAAPYGTWEVQVIGQTPDPSWPTVTLAPDDTTPRSTIDVDINP